MTLKKIKNIIRTVSKFSTTGQINSIRDEYQINDLLDSINDFKKELSEKTEQINEINSRIDRLKHYRRWNENYVFLVNDVVSSAKDLYSSLICQYISMNTISKRNIARKEITCYKNSILRLKEACKELESLIPEELTQYKRQLI